jgi:molecular chaperone DnaJ
MTDYYKILGIEKGATKEQIKKAYKKLAKKYHPDLNPDNKEAEAKFKEINEAVSVLADEQKRQHYDQFGTADGQNFQGFDFSDFMKGQSFGEFFTGFDSVFDQLFGGRGRRSKRGQARGPDIAQEVNVELEEIATGKEQTVNLNKLDPCRECDGQGGDRKKCGTCDGAGMQMRTQRTPFGIFQTTSSCSNCRGTGSTIVNECLTCHGEGRVRVKRNIEIQIPPGIEDGTQLRVRGEGMAGEHGGMAGDLYIVVRIREHPIFKRNGNSILLDVPLSFTQAVLGDEIDVPVLNGKALLKIPAYTQNNTIFRMRGKGLQNHAGVGDQYVKVEIKIPERLSKKQKDLVRQMAKLEKEKPTSILKKFFG